MRRIDSLVLLPQPVEIEALLTSVRAALRSRRRQYQLRRHLEEQKQVERALRESEEHYRRLFESIDEGFCIIEMRMEPDKPLDYRFLEVNPAFARQSGLANAKGKWMRELCAEHEQTWFELYRDVALTGIPVRLDRAGWVSRERWFSLFAFRVGLPEQRRVAILFNDITERRRIEEELRSAKATAEDANRAKDDFLAVLSHELRTPLTPVLAAVSLLETDPAIGPAMKEGLEIIHRNAVMEARLIDDLLDVTRISRGKVDFQRKPVSLRRVISEAVEVCMPDIRAKGLEFGIEEEQGPFIVDADPSRLQQVFWNLLRNALKFTRSGGSVGIRCRRAGRSVEVEVHDTGAGIAPEQLPLIFNAFEQGGAQLTRRFGGLGLGLTISKAIVEMHGGTIQAHSAGKGKGASFLVTLPLSVVEPCSETGAPVSTPLSHAAPGLKILLVEDHADTARIMRRLLRLGGHRVEIASDAGTATAMMEADRFDLLLSDLGLPDASGLELLRQLRRRGHNLPAIALSGYGQEGDILQSREAGFAIHLTKPVDPDQLTRAIAAVSTVCTDPRGGRDCQPNPLSDRPGSPSGDEIKVYEE